MADAGQVHLKRLGVIGLIVCACVAGYLWQRSALPQSRASISFDGGDLELAAMVDASPPGLTEQMLAVEYRPARPLFGMDTEPVFAGLASKWRAIGLNWAKKQRCSRIVAPGNLVQSPRETF